MIIGNMEKIFTDTSRAELIAQLAEECAELGHAALKLRRAIDGANPTPVTFDEALEAFQEEAADVLLCMALTVPGVYGDMGISAELKKRIDAKARRWADRLRERDEEKAKEKTPAAAGTSSACCAGTFPKGEDKGDGENLGDVDAIEKARELLKQIMGIQSPSEEMKNSGLEEMITLCLGAFVDAFASVMPRDDAEAE